MQLVIRRSLDTGSPDSAPIEVVERKGLGHPDTICDALAERFSAGLCRYYLCHFGRILHHNVDKVLLVGGASRPELGAGEVLEPIEITLAGRATTEVRGERVPIDEIAAQAAHAYFRETFRALDPERHVRVRARVRPGSPELSELFGRAEAGATSLANDSSIGAGFAPLSRLEKLVLEVDQAINAPEFRSRHPASGEDVKLMAIRRDDSVELVLSRAFIGRHLPDVRTYAEEKQRLAHCVREMAERRFERVEVQVNAADDLETGSLFLTVTGTSAESGDDGQAGRGNRASGLITPYRPMTLEAVAGKNPVSHVGKLYNLVAGRIAQAVIEHVHDIESASCVLVSRIGSPVTEPRLVDVRAHAVGYRELAELRPQIDQLARAELAELPRLWEPLIRGELAVV
jgi:S-adenosylmethionine synthetase